MASVVARRQSVVVVAAVGEQMSGGKRHRVDQGVVEGSRRLAGLGVVHAVAIETRVFGVVVLRRLATLRVGR